jgi:transposase
LTPAEVARKHAISSGQLYTWRRQLLSMPGAVIERAMPQFAELDLAATSPGTSEPPPPSGSAPPAPMCPGGMIEIMLPNGVSFRVDAEVDGGAFRWVLDALARPVISLAAGLRVYLACGATDIAERF